MDRHQNGEARVIPVILRPCDWKTAIFAKLQALPTDGKPVISWKTRDDAFLNVVDGIRDVLKKMGYMGSPATAGIPVANPPAPAISVKGGHLANKSDLSPPHFFGQTLREQTLEEIGNKSTSHPILAIEGLPGAGKTFAISEFAQRCCSGSPFHAAYWHTCQHNETLDELFIELRSVFEVSGTLEAKCKSLITQLRRINRFSSSMIFMRSILHRMDRWSIQLHGQAVQPPWFSVSETFVNAGWWPVIGHLEVAGFNELELQAYLKSRDVVVPHVTLIKLHSKTDGLPLAASLFATLVGQFNEDPRELLAGEMPNVIPGSANGLKNLECT